MISIESMVLNSYANYPDWQRVQKVVIILLQNIGDVILATPVFATLKGRFPDMRVDAVVNKGTEDVLLDNPNITHIHVFDHAGRNTSLLGKLNHRRGIVQAVREVGYDMAMTLTVSTKGRMLCLLSGAGIRVGIGRREKYGFGLLDPLTHWVRHPGGKRHYLERHLDCLRHLGLFPTEAQRQSVLFEGDAARARMEAVLAEAGLETIPFVVIHPTSRWMFKCWPADAMAQLMNRMHAELGVRMILTAAPDPRENNYVVQLKTCLKAPVLDLAGQLTLRELIALIRRAHLFVGVDSAPMHMAVAVKTPSVVLFGPSSEWDWGPRGDLHRLVVSDRFPCRPCQIDGCGGSKISECLLDISVDTVFEQVQKQLACCIVPAT
ncbi:MAG: putative lipopolysaccharide heptosyltransferase III [Magnetococcus sp. YQC-5]